MTHSLSKKIINILIIFFLGLQLFIYTYNQTSLTNNYSQKSITVENFSSIVLSNSGITKIGSEKLDKLDDNLLTILKKREKPLFAPASDTKYTLIKIGDKDYLKHMPTIGKAKDRD